MKAFRFRLERILAWRQTQLSIETAKLERLQAERRELGHKRRNLIERRAAAHLSVSQAANLQVIDLAELENLRRWTQNEERKLELQLKKLEGMVEQQTRCLADANRNVRLLEKLKERHLAEWQATVDREVEGLAAESAIGRWLRADRQSVESDLPEN